MREANALTDKVEQKSTGGEIESDEKKGLLNVI